MSCDVHAELFDLEAVRGDAVRGLRDELYEVAVRQEGLPPAVEQLQRSLTAFLAAYGPRDEKGSVR